MRIVVISIQPNLVIHYITSFLICQCPALNTWLPRLGNQIVTLAFLQSQHSWCYLFAPLPWIGFEPTVRHCIILGDATHTFLLTFMRSFPKCERSLSPGPPGGFDTAIPYGHEGLSFICILSITGGYSTIFLPTNRSHGKGYEVWNWHPASCGLLPI